MVNQVRNLKHALVIATLASVVATVGDFFMLYVVNTGSDVLTLTSDGTTLLIIGYFLGIFAIPLYGIGFWAVANILATGTPRAGRIVLVSGVIMAVLGGIIHGVTGISIEAQIRAGVTMKEPMGAIFEYGVYLLPLWGAASIASCLGSVAFARGVACGKSGLSRFIGIFNPVVLTVFVGLAGTATPMLRNFLIPAAPNVAHVLFFGLITALVFKGDATGVKR